jgi:carbonic anhydrase
MSPKTFWIVVWISLVLEGCGSQEAAPSPGASAPLMTRERQTAMTPSQALQRLREGNERFVAGRSLRRDLPGEVRATASGQYPIAAVVSCLDSRVSPELVFDQGLGDIFSARVAGNVIDDDITGSLEYATQASGAKLIVLVGHSGCGAIKGACHQVELGHLTQLLNKIEPSVRAVKFSVGGEADRMDAAFVDEVGRENVRRMLRRLLEESPIIKERVDRGELKVVGAFQDLATGRVHFLD